jgi:3-oxoacyl-[acyl-carrier-protein] synthase II
VSVSAIAMGAISALGEGWAAVSAGEPGEPARVALGLDPALERAGLARPFAARVSLPGGGSPEDRASAILAKAALACASDLDRVLPDWRAERVGLAVGTSSGGLESAELVFSHLRSLPSGRPVDMGLRRVEDAFYFAPVLRAAELLGLRLAPATVVLGACAASTLAIGLAQRWLEDGRFDAVSVFVAAGFEVLGATTAEPPPRPFCMGRDGMALGEGAALVALVPTARCARTERGASGHPLAGPRAYVHVAGFGASSDAVHLTAPDRTGAGLARAAARAIAEAGHPRIDLVSAHGTATPFSDAAEARALGIVLGGDSAGQVAVHAFKAQVGHTLGASGVLEALVCADALERGLLPSSAGRGVMDPDTPIRLLTATLRASPETALKLSAAFGGANAALVLSKGAEVESRVPTSSRTGGVRREVYLSRAVHVPVEPDAASLSEALGRPIERLVRTDGLTRMALLAVARLDARLGSLSGAAIIVGEAFATIETNAAFHARIEERGARMAEPRRFPYTSPNAAPGECSALFGLTGPGFAVGSGPCAGLEALLIGADLVRGGDADRAVIVAVDAIGPVVGAMCERLGVEAASGAVGLVLSCDPRGAAYRLGETRLELGPWGEGPTVGMGHRALLPLVERDGSPCADRVLEAGGPLARVPAAEGVCWALRATARIESV